MSDIEKSQDADMPYHDDAPMDLAPNMPDLASEEETSARGGFGDQGVTQGLPPQRVRFATVAKLSFDGYEETFEVSVLNLSESGVACTGPRGMARGDRCRLGFRLHLAEAPESFLCEVVWVHEPEAMQVDQVGDDDEANYGMRFVDLDSDVAEKLQALVQERTDGRAAAWTLPVMPTPAHGSREDFVLSATADDDLAADDVAGDYFGDVLGSVAEAPAQAPSLQAQWVRASRRTETWVAAGLGLAVGLGVALLAGSWTGQSPQAVVPAPVADAVHQGTQGAGAATQRAAEAVREIPEAAVAGVEAAARATAQAAKPVVKAAEAEGRRAKAVVVKQAQASSALVKAAAPAAASADAEAARGAMRPIAQRVRELAIATAPAPTQGPSRTSAAAQNNARPRVEGNASRATLVLTADGAVKDPHVFWMADPRRLVVDIAGRQSAADGKVFDVDHPIVSRVRVGKHPDKVRFVIETGKDVTSQLTTRVQGNTVRVELRRP